MFTCIPTKEASLEVSLPDNSESDSKFTESFNKIKVKYCMNSIFKSLLQLKACDLNKNSRILNKYS